MSLFTSPSLWYLFSDLSLVPPWQYLEVGLQGAAFNGLLVEVLVWVLTKEDVVLEGSILYPGLLGHIRHTALRGGWGKGNIVAV